MARTTSHKVIALISGGKDSFMSILQCQKYGHQIVALGNLFPPAQDSTSDLNSYMYQTAGHALIPFYTEALQIPLYRQEIFHKTNHFEKEYDQSRLDAEQQDETEDLTTLLRHILTKHPDATAVCSGAILSTYQRTRIESVCGRLGLQSLAFLWELAFLPSLHETAAMFDMSCAFLDHIAEVGLDARIVKVASGGLDETFLWKSLLDPVVRSKLKAVMRRFGGSVIGEGGEFETLVLSGPKTLFQGEIIVPDSAIQIRQGEAGEAWIDISDSSGIITKLYEFEGTLEEKSMPRTTPHTKEQPVPQMTIRTEVVAIGSQSPEWSRPLSTISTSDNFLYINNLSDDAHSCQRQIQNIVNRLKDILVHEKTTVGSLVFATIILKSMEDFGVINQTYGSLFSLPLPPARVTIAIGKMMPHGIDVLLSCVAYCGQLNRKQGLHIQSLSAWAPANIGPYSQAISVPLDDAEESQKMVHIAGQIPLVPETMLPYEIQNGRSNDASFKVQAELAFRHATRIGIAMQAVQWIHAIVYICSNQDAEEKARIAYQVWKDVHALPVDDDKEEEALDIWDLKHGRHTANHEENRRGLPMEVRGIPNFVAVEVDQLPRNQSIEWQTLAVTTATGDHQKAGSRSTSPNRLLFFAPDADLNDLDEQNFAQAVMIPCYRIWIPDSDELKEQQHFVL